MEQGTADHSGDYCNHRNQTTLLSSTLACVVVFSFMLLPNPTRTVVLSHLVTLLWVVSEALILYM